MFWKWHVGGSVNDSMSLGCSLSFQSASCVLLLCYIYIQHGGFLQHCSWGMLMQAPSFMLAIMFCIYFSWWGLGSFAFFVHWELHSGFCNVVETGHCGVFFVVLFVIPGLIYEKTLMGLSYKIREDFILSLF